MRLKFIGIASLLLVLGYSGSWYVQSGEIKNHVQSSLEHLRQEFKKTNANVRIQWDDITRAGFPFAPSAAITAPTLSMVYNGKSYSVGFESLTFAPGGIAGSGREGVYALLPSEQRLRAMYADPGNAPERYSVTWDAPVSAKLLAYKPGVTPARCLPGQPCDSLPDDAFALSHMRVSLPPSMILMATLGNESAPIQFRFNDLQRASLALDRPIPEDVTRPLQLFVGMLREALVYR